jgi:hypothetical protein
MMGENKKRSQNWGYAQNMGYAMNPIKQHSGIFLLSLLLSVGLMATTA